MVCHLVCDERDTDLTCEEYMMAEGLQDCFNRANHNVLYSLHKKETISDTKVLVAQHVATDTWTDGSHQVRALLGLPLTGNVTLTPEGIKKGYRLFVQSTSWNRKIKAGTHVIVEVTREQLDKHASPDGDTRMEHLTASIGTDTTQKPEVEYDATFENDNTTLKETFAERLSNKKSPEKPPKKKPAPKKPAVKAAAPKSRGKKLQKKPKFPRKTISKAPKRLQRSNTMVSTAKEGEEFVRLMDIKARKEAIRLRHEAKKAK